MPLRAIQLHSSTHVSEVSSDKTEYSSILNDAATIEVNGISIEDVYSNKGRRMSKKVYLKSRCLWGDAIALALTCVASLINSCSFANSVPAELDVPTFRTLQ